MQDPRTLREPDLEDRRLPPDLRGRDGFPRLIAGIPLRVCVTGTGGAFALTRLAHAALRARRIRVYAKASCEPHGGASGQSPGRRRRAHRATQEALRADLKRAWPLQALVLEGGLAGPAGLSAFNRDVLQATHVLVPSVSRDPLDGSRRLDPARAVALAASVPTGATLVSGERDPGLQQAMLDEAERRGVRFVDAAPRDRAAMPGLELATVLDALLVRTVGAGLSAGERVRHMARLQRQLRWTPSSLQALRWFDGSRLPNAPALRSVLDHLARSDPARMHAIVHVQPQRRRQAAWLAPVLRQALQDEVLAHVHLVGAGTAPLAQALRHLPTSIFAEGKASIDSVTRTVERECHGGAVVTLGDTAGPWAAGLTAKLRHPDHPPGLWCPSPTPRWPGAAMPLEIPVLHAPRMGRRPVVHILGDPDPAPIAQARPKPSRAIPPATATAPVAMPFAAPAAPPTQTLAHVFVGS